MNSFAENLRRQLGEESAPTYRSLVSEAPPSLTPHVGTRLSSTTSYAPAASPRKHFFLYGLLVVCVILAFVNPSLAEAFMGERGHPGLVYTLLTFPSPWIQSMVMVLSSISIAVLAVANRGLSRVNPRQRWALTVACWGGILGSAPTILVIVTMVALVILIFLTLGAVIVVLVDS